MTTNLFSDAVAAHLREAEAVIGRPFHSCLGPEQRRRARIQMALIGAEWRTPEDFPSAASVAQQGLRAIGIHARVVGQTLVVPSDQWSKASAANPDQ